MFFLFFHKNCCGYSLEVPQRGISNEYHNICFHGEIRKKSTILGLKKCLIWSYGNSMPWFFEFLGMYLYD